MLSLLLAGAPAFAQDLTVAANVDKTTVAVGEPFTVTITVSGDLEGVEVPPATFPEGFAVAARSQSTNFSMRSGAIERSMGMTFVLAAQQAGAFEIGPFTIRKGKQELHTEPIAVTVTPSALQPKRRPPPQGERFTL